MCLLDLAPGCIQTLYSFDQKIVPDREAHVDGRRYLENKITTDYTDATDKERLYVGRDDILPSPAGWVVPHDAPYVSHINRIACSTVEWPPFDLPTLLAAAGVHPSRQHALIRLTCAFLRNPGSLLSVPRSCPWGVWLQVFTVSSSVPGLSGGSAGGTGSRMRLYVWRPLSVLGELLAPLLDV
ncbi:hypothetical protein GWK47_019773 [Chionoecetes opilio]|uniref:Uncharacterized protein n=1 Tax=Chionoecetes opilio TaxID=41210 RepID=A0A8J5CFM3_CHIOP|nr:hypothetical protein GWK47_019773 [Chionoecetes opilio]